MVLYPQSQRNMEEAGISKSLLCVLTMVLEYSLCNSGCRVIARPYDQVLSVSKMLSYLQQGNSLPTKMCQDSWAGLPLT